jgi:hypothetical protein
MIIEKYVDGKPISVALCIISGEKLKNFKNAQFSSVQGFKVQRFRVLGFTVQWFGGFRLPAAVL